jgi:hypothetical protein
MPKSVSSPDFTDGPVSSLIALLIAPDCASLRGILLFGGKLDGTQFVIATIVVWCRTLSMAGYNGATARLIMIPIANLAAICIIAFGDSPVLKELRSLRKRGNQPPWYPPPDYDPPRAG